MKEVIGGSVKSGCGLRAKMRHKRQGFLVNNLFARRVSNYLGIRSNRRLLHSKEALPLYLVVIITRAIHLNQPQLDRQAQARGKSLAACNPCLIQELRRLRQTGLVTYLDLPG